MTTNTTRGGHTGSTALSESDLDDVHGGDIKLVNPRITSYQLGFHDNASSGDSVPIEEVAINFEAVRRPS